MELIEKGNSKAAPPLKKELKITLPDSNLEDLETGRTPLSSMANLISSKGVSKKPINEGQAKEVHGDNAQEPC
jgi:hypothetical protein